MQFERGKPPESPNAPYRAARIKDERWRSAGPGFEPGRIAEFKAIPRPTKKSSNGLWYRREDTIHARMHRSAHPM
jgi:hypothetical protein